MLKLFAKLLVLSSVITVLLAIYWQSFIGQPVLSKSLDIHSLKSTIVATATAPPKLVSAVLGGKPVYVLYVTRSEDTVLVRCYPGYEPAIVVRPMGRNPNSNTQKEGVMTCRPAT